MDIQNKTIFITGGADGIGFATAKRLLSEGANVIIYSKGVDKIRKDEIDLDRTLIIEGDVYQRDQVMHAMQLAVDRFGTVDVLINNAGVARREQFLETDEKDWDFIFNVNVKGVFICIQEFIKINDKNSTGKLVVNIASGAGIYGVDEIAVYSASKAAVINISQSLDEELKNTGVKFMSIAPGATETKMFNSLFPEENAYHTPDQIAEVIYKAIIGDVKPDGRLVVDVFRHITKVDEFDQKR